MLHAFFDGVHILQVEIDVRVKLFSALALLQSWSRPL